VQKLCGIIVTYVIFPWCRDLRLATPGIQVRSFGLKESGEFGDAGARVVVPFSWVGVQDGGVEEVAAAGWRRESRHVVDVFRNRELGDVRIKGSKVGA
jgi:hypothetical protein